MPKSRKKVYLVYRIAHEGTDRYVGMTCDRVRREKTHNYLFRKGAEKQLYDWLREQGFKGKIAIVPVREFAKKVDAKRYEILLVLQDYFGDQMLKQKIPSIGR